jgi:hypothetical protein
MTLLKRSTSKRDKARKAVQGKAKSAKRTAKRKIVFTLAKRFVPTRALVVLGGAGAAVVAAVTLKKKRGGGAKSAAAGS